MSREIRKTNCNKCGSSDGNAVYDDGHTYCFVCNTYKKSFEDIESFEDNKVTFNIEDLQFRTNPDRKVTRRVCEMFGVRSEVNTDGNVSVTYYPYETKSGTSYKVRTLPKDFRVTKGLDGAKLFGQGLWAGASRKRLVITEGEEDALAVAQAYDTYNGNIYPVVSLPSSSNLKPVAENLEWIREFEEVVLFIDNDDAGNTCVDKLAKIIGYAKCKVARGTYKDASDILTKDSHTAVMQAIWNAKTYNPTGILSGDSLWKALEAYDEIESVPYPSCMPGLNHKLKGMRQGEITLFTSGTGSGKSTILREIAWHLVQNTEDKIGIIALEESPAETARKLSGLAISRNPAAEEIPLEDLREGFNQVFGDERVLVLDHAGAITDGIVSQLEYMAAVGCKYLFIDHITILVSEGAEGLEGNAAIDKVMNDLLKVAKVHNVWIGLVSHLRKTGQGKKAFEEGQLPSLDDIKGSGSIKQISMDIIAFARDSANEDDLIRNTVDLKVLKCRYTGLTGPAGKCKYIHNTGRLIDGEANWDEIDVPF